MAKKLFLFVTSIVLMFSSCAFSHDDVKVGILSKLNMSAEELKSFISDAREAGKTKIFSLDGSRGEITFIFYDSLTTLQNALNRGDVDEIALPESVAEYMLNTNSDYEIAAIARCEPVSLSFGFKKSDDPELRYKFNNALQSMNADGTLAMIISKFITGPVKGNPESTNFTSYENADTMKVAVTGDLPPIDYVSPEGKAEGFNVAVLAEIGRRLHINVELIDIDSGARAASLASGRSDVVFWFESTKSDIHADIPEGVVLSEAYFSWDEILHIRKK